jgi:hypothetical protein
VKRVDNGVFITIEDVEKVGSRAARTSSST